MLADKDICIGCSVCATVCPHDAIKMVYDENEFLHPIIDEKLCCKCNICTKHCPVLNQKLPSKLLEKTYSAYAKDNNIQLQSASGGFATVLSELIIENGGVVYGVAYDYATMHVKYACAKDKNELQPFKGTKLVFSELMPPILNDIKRKILEGTKVLFIGCPCEISAVQSYLRELKGEVIYLGLICQGATTSKALKRWILERIDGEDEKVVYLNMRTKNETSHSIVSLRTSGGYTYEEELTKSSFFELFRWAKRECCYQCKFKYENYWSDFICGDGIGLRENDEGYHRDGVSTIIVRTEKGEKLLKQLNDLMVIEEQKQEKVLGQQEMLFRSFPRSINREKLLNEVETIGVKLAVRNFREVNLQDLDNCVIEAGISKYDNCKIVIWGIGRNFERTYETICNYYPKAEIVAIVDKYNSGNRHGIDVISPRKLKEVEFDYVFITTVAGQNEAIESVRKIKKKEVYSLVMLPHEKRNISKGT